jgi:hypothetical protein
MRSLSGRVYTANRAEYGSTERSARSVNGRFAHGDNVAVLLMAR